MDGEVYIVDNGDIYCGQPRYILWIHLIYIYCGLPDICCGLHCTYMLWTTLDIYVVDIPQYMYLYSNIKKNRLNTK